MTNDTTCFPNFQKIFPQHETSIAGSCLTCSTDPEPITDRSMDCDWEAIVPNLCHSPLKRRMMKVQLLTTLKLINLHCTEDYSIKPYSNSSGPTVYNSGALLLPPTLKFWNDSNLRSCAWLWTPHGTSQIHSSEGTSAALQSKKKSAVTALTMVIDFAPIPIISQ
jgi:hypothetical protein